VDRRAPSSSHLVFLGIALSFPSGIAPHAWHRATTRPGPLRSRPIRRVLLSAAPFHRRAGPVDLGPFVVALLMEGRRQDDPPLRGDPVRDAAPLVFEVEPQLEKPCVRLRLRGIRVRAFRNITDCPGPQQASRAQGAAPSGSAPVWGGPLPRPVRETDAGATVRTEVPSPGYEAASKRRRDCW
jgi:hypothetical protein